MKWWQQLKTRVEAGIWMMGPVCLISYVIETESNWSANFSKNLVDNISFHSIQYYIKISFPLNSLQTFTVLLEYSNNDHLNNFLYTVNCIIVHRYIVWKAIAYGLFILLLVHDTHRFSNWEIVLRSLVYTVKSHCICNILPEPDFMSLLTRPLKLSTVLLILILPLASAATFFFQSRSRIVLNRFCSLICEN